MPIQEVLVVTVVLLVASSAVEKVVHRDSFRYRLVDVGLAAYSSPVHVAALGLLELSAGILAVASIGISQVLILPLLLLMIAFTIFLLVYRPRRCGCGFLEMPWNLASVRNLAVIGLLVLVAIGGY